MHLDRVGAQLIDEILGAHPDPMAARLPQQGERAQAEAQLIAATVMRDEGGRPARHSGKAAVISAPMRVMTQAKYIQTMKIGIAASAP
jgi:hypothetical protein